MDSGERFCRNGSYGEGGEQVLRTSLALSAVLKIPVTVHHIRAGRDNPGLQPQHLNGVEALVRITEGQTEGVKPLGRRGKRAEDVAKEAVDELKAYLESGGCLDPHLSDRIIAFLGLAKGNSSFTTSKISEHLVTSLWLVRQFLEVEVATRGKRGERGRIDFRHPERD